MTNESGFKVTIESVVLIFLVVANLEMNLTYFFDNLDHFEALKYFPFLQTILLPYGDANPLIILGKKFTPIKLILRSLSILALLLYCFLDTGCIKRRNSFLKWFLLSATIFMLVFFPTALTIVARHRGGHQELAHDGGVIQIEEAVKMMISGRNPYSETFIGTPLEFWRGFRNNAVYHYPYPPFSFICSLPFYLVCQVTLGWFDQRFMYLLFMIGSFIMAGLLFSLSHLKRLAVMWLGLNPLLNHLFALGSSDVGTIFLVLVSLYLHSRQRWKTSALVLALACSYKQFAVFLVPFLMVEQWYHADLSLRNFLKIWSVFMVVLALINLPYFLWSPRDFFADTVLYSSGGLPTSYQMQGFHGYGFASFLLFLKIVPDGNVYYPFWIWQLFLVVPVAVHWLFKQARIGGIATVLWGFSLTLFVFMYFSRYLNGNFLGFILTWPVLAWLAEISPGKSED